MFGITHQIAWAGLLKPQTFMWVASELHSTGGPPFEIPPYSIFRPKSGQESINIFSHFHELITETNYQHLECSITLGMHSQVCRCQLSQICDISPLSNARYQVMLIFFTFSLNLSVIQSQEHRALSLKAALESMVLLKNNKTNGLPLGTVDNACVCNYNILCMYVCMYVCMYMRTYIRIYVCMYVCMWITHTYIHRYIYTYM